MTDAQLNRAESLGDRDGFGQVTYVKGYIEEVPFRRPLPIASSATV